MGADSSADQEDFSLFVFIVCYNDDDQNNADGGERGTRDEENDFRYRFCRESFGLLFARLTEDAGRAHSGGEGSSWNGEIVAPLFFVG